MKSEKGVGRSGKLLHFKGCVFHRVITAFMAQVSPSQNLIMHQFNEIMLHSSGYYTSLTVCLMLDLRKNRVVILQGTKIHKVSRFFFSWNCTLDVTIICPPYHFVVALIVSNFRGDGTGGESVSFWSTKGPMRFYAEWTTSPVVMMGRNAYRVFCILPSPTNLTLHWINRFSNTKI